MHYFELTITAYLLKNLAFNEVNEKIAQLDALIEYAGDWRCQCDGIILW